MRRPVATSGSARFHRRRVEKAQNVVRRDVIQFPKRCAEAEGHEAPEKGLAFLDRCLAQSLLVTQPVAVRRAEILERPRCRGSRRRWRGAVTVTGWCQLRVASSFLL